MKFVIAFLIFCSMQNQLVQSETMDDVLENFRPAFDEMYGVLDTLTKTLSTYAEERVRRFKTDANELLDNILQDVSAAQEVLHESEAKILEELGLVGQAHVIRDCIKEKNNTFLNEKENVDVTYYIGTYLRDTISVLVNNSLESFNHKQHVRRLLIEETKYKCKAGSSLPHEMQTCIYNEIHSQHKPALVELEKDMGAIQREVEATIIIEGAIIAGGFFYNKPVLSDYQRFVVNEFRSCCYKVVGKN